MQQGQPELFCFDMILSMADIWRGYLVECADLCSRFVPSMIGVQAYLNKTYGNNKYIFE